MTALDHLELVAALRAVPGVSDADVQPDDEGGLGTLRLDLDSGVDEAVVAAHVGRLLREQFGIGVDADRVQIVEDAVVDWPFAAAGKRAASDGHRNFEDTLSGQVGGARPAMHFESVEVAALLPEARQAVRPAIARMHLVSSGLEVTASVTLASNDRTAVGEVRGTASQSGVHRAVATATLRAVEELVDGQVRFELDHLEVTAMGKERTVVVALTMLSGKGTERLTGAAGVREDVRQAVIRATLDALNRRLEMLLTPV